MSHSRLKSVSRDAVLIALPIIVIASLFLVNLPIHTSLISNVSLLSPQWVSGYCRVGGQSSISCPVTVTKISNNLIRIYSTGNLSTILFQLYPSYENLFSHPSITYNLVVDSASQDNVTFKFSQVNNSTYYSEVISSVTTSQGSDSNSVLGSLNIESMRQSLGRVIGDPVRVEMNVSPPTSQLDVALSLISEDNNTVGALLTTSSLRSSGLFATLGIFYSVLAKSRVVKILGIGVMGTGTVIFANTAAGPILSAWPPLDPSLTWLFSLGVVSGLGILVLYFATQRAKI